MESNNTLPTAQEYLDKYFIKLCGTNFGDTLFQKRPAPTFVEHHVVKANHEYAVLFAKWHREKQIESIIDNSFQDTSVEPCLYTFDSKSDIINAYPESEIV